MPNKPPELPRAESAEKPWFLYMLECKGGYIYTGITTDVASRFDAHVAGKGAKFTRANRPIRILKTFSCPDKCSAAKAEYRIKQLTAAQKRALCAN